MTLLLQLHAAPTLSDQHASEKRRKRKGEDALLPKRKKIHRALGGLFRFRYFTHKTRIGPCYTRLKDSIAAETPPLFFFRPIANARLRERILYPRVHDIRPPPDRRSSKDLSLYAVTTARHTPSPADDELPHNRATLQCRKVKHARVCTSDSTACNRDKTLAVKIKTKTVSKNMVLDP
jgi:hypothetical protein